MSVSVGLPLDVAFRRTGTAPSGALLLGVWEGGIVAGGRRMEPLAKAVERALRAEPAFRGKLGQVLDLVEAPGLPSRRVVLVGLGEREKAEGLTFRRAGGEAGAKLADAGIEEATADLDLGPGDAVEFAYGVRLRTHHLPHFRTVHDPEQQPPVRQLTVLTDSPEAAAEAWTAAEATAEGVAQCRDLTREPANRLTTTAFVERAEGLADLGVDVEVLDRAALKKAGLGLHLAVGQASIHPPYLVLLRWRGAAGGEAPALLVGKGLCFDTGGISIKPAAGMEEMRGDMAGAAAVLGTMLALAKSKAPVNVTGILGLAENMPGDNAFRPGDILRSHSGQTVEIIDTDAEGRLVLADALSYGCERERPRCAVDLATLTGSIVTALGAHHGGLFTADDRLAEDLTAAGRASGDLLWRMPLTDAVDDDLKSEVADVRQCAPAGRLLPDALHAARFLQRFVPDNIPYAHLDIAGVSERSEADGYQPAGPTGYGVALLVRWLTAGRGTR